jgi:hypothetical protein
MSVSDSTARPNTVKISGLVEHYTTTLQRRIVSQVPLDDHFGDIAFGDLITGTYTFHPAAIDQVPDPASGSCTAPPRKGGIASAIHTRSSPGARAGYGCAIWIFGGGLSTSGLYGLCFRPSTPAMRFGPKALREPAIGGVDQLFIGTHLNSSRKVRSWKGR